MVEVSSLNEEGGTSGNGNPDHNHKKNEEGRNGSRSITSVVMKALCVAGGFFLIQKLTKSTSPTRVDHAAIVAEALSGEKSSSEQAARDPMTYFKLRMLTCPAIEMVNGSKLLYFEKAFWRAPEKPYRQRFYVVKPCRKDMKCDVEMASYAIKNVEEYRNFCVRPDSQRPHSDEVLGNVAEHLNTVYLSQCERGRQCLYEGSTPPGGFPNSWNGATHYTSELTICRDGEIHCWDRFYNDEGNQ
ncbi:hypothetical protein KI387_036189, partial [Taxus chinensis]